MRLTPVMQRYIVHWGEMGSRWGVNRSVAQIHALLYLSPQPVHADEIAETLGIARSNVSMGLKELLAWDLIQVTHTLGDRRDFFLAPHDPWEVIQIVVEGSRKRARDRSHSRHCCANAPWRCRRILRHRRRSAIGSSRRWSFSRL